MLDDSLNLTMVADLSHWINVAETDTNDPDLTAVIEALAPRFRHIHLRVGYDHGPQVTRKLVVLSSFLRRVIVEKDKMPRVSFPY